MLALLFSGFSQQRSLPVPLFLMLITLLVGCQNINFPNLNRTNQSPAQEAEALIGAAEDALYSVAEDKQIGALFLQTLRQPNVAGVIITPNMIKAGVFFGGSGGAGVLLARADNGVWSYPTFIRQGGGSFGVQVGFQSSKVVSVISSPEQLVVMLNGSPIAGGEASGSFIDEGAGFDYAGGLDVTSALRSFAVGKGAFVGLDVKLGGLWTDSVLNKAFYGSSSVTPQDIVLKAAYQNPKANGLRQLLAQFAR